ncbi:hypothetical protein ACE2AJ_04725 [Aquihabitans daechungensis]|uniref:hypothetical protein n=1 Tax=Aquihabitans daechungensis TaxID=1052257 RepID=UPI003B9FE8C8
MPAFARLRSSAAGLVAVGLLGLAACGSPPTTSGSGAGRGGGEDAKVSAKDCPLDALEKAKEPVKVNMWFGGVAPRSPCSPTW